MEFKVNSILFSRLYTGTIMLTFGNNIINASLNIPEQKLFFRSAQKKYRHPKF